MATSFNIIELFLSAAQNNPQRIAIIDKTGSVSFEKLKQQILDTAAYFRQKGIGAEDRVLIFVPMSIHLYRIVLALFYLGATAVFLDEWVGKKRMEACCKIAQCKAFIAIPKIRLLSFLSAPLRQTEVKLGLYYKKSSHFFLPPFPAKKSDVALVTFTTGTTGTPKAAMRSHGLLQEQFLALAEKIQPREGETDLPALPIVLLINLGAGSTSVIAHFKAAKPDKMNEKKIWQQIILHQVARMEASPFFVNRLAQYVIENNLPASPLKKIFTGGAPVFPAEAALFAKAFPQAQIEIVYGSTEAEPISTISAGALMNEESKMLQKGLCVGIPHSKIKVRIIRIGDDVVKCSNAEMLDAISLPNDVVGEIIVSGPHVLNAYFNNENALLRNKIFIGDACWHRTGDSGFLSHGKLYLTGRVSALIHHEGKRLSPFIYQYLLQSIAGVKMGTILKAGNKLFAVLELKKNANTRTVAEEVSALPIRFDEIKILPHIPRDPRHYSRIDDEKLKKMLMADFS